jgi:hypothetical protein
MTRKSHKTPEQIAKIHGVSLDFIKNQLEIGIKVEYEHTTSKSSAKIIALQHLEEIPDYYTRLKKMEKTPKKSMKENLSLTIEDLTGTSFLEIHDLILPEPLKRTTTKEEKDHEYSMARSELKTAQKAVQRLQKKMKGEGNIEAWVQSKITRASEYLDTVADYIESGEHNVEESILPPKLNADAIKSAQKQEKIRTKATDPKENPNVRNVAKSKLRRSNKVELFPTSTNTEEVTLVDKILGEIKEEKPGLWANIAAKKRRGERSAKPGEKGYPKTLEIEEGLKQARKNVGAKKCWSGYTAKKSKVVNGEEVPDCQKENIEYTEDVVCPYCGSDPCECEGEEKYDVSEAVRIPAQTGNIISVTLNWRGKYIGIQLFFPQARVPSRSEITYEIEKIYPGARVIQHSISTLQPGSPFVQVASRSKNYVKPMGEEVEITEAKKSEMPCNKPKAQSVGDSETGKSHVVKACSGGQEKLIRFGQRGVKGSPKKKGESKEYASRRNRFKTRHAKNIAKGKMSAAYWSNRVKW